MKKCPYCAEKIQNDAIKCKHCGEWLSKPTETSNDVQEKQDEQLDLSSSMSIEVEAKIPSEPIDNDDNHEMVSDSPLKQKPKWGWGWFLLLAFIVPGLQQMRGVSDNAKAISFLFSVTIPILLITFYFWNRLRIINKNKYATKIWTYSFTAGFETYIVALLIFGLAYFFIQVQDRKDNNIFFAQIQHKAEIIKNDEIKINEILSNSLETAPKSSKTVDALRQYLQLINRKRELSAELFRYAGKYGAAKKDNEIINDSAKIKLVSSELFQKYEDAINILISYCSSGDEKLYKKYEKLTSETTLLENEYKLLSGNLTKKIQF